MSTIPCGAPGYTISLQFGIIRAVLAPVIGNGALASLSPCTINVGNAILCTCSRKSAAEIVLRQASATGNGTLSIMALIQERVSLGVSGVKNGSSFSSIQRGKSLATASSCASINSLGTPSGLLVVFKMNGVTGAANTSRATLLDPRPAQSRTASMEPIE